MDEVKRTMGYFVEKAKSITQSFTLAVNGAFFSIRSAGYTPNAHQIEKAKLDVSQARYVYIDGINNLIDEILNFTNAHNIRLNEVKFDLATMHLIAISNEITHQANRAISSGHQNKAASMLKGKAHGAMGLLVQQKLMSVDLATHDIKGRKWATPTIAVESVMNWLMNEAIEG